jgi:hypothetical protein
MSQGCIYECRLVCIYHLGLFRAPNRPRDQPNGLRIVWIDRGGDKNSRGIRKINGACPVKVFSNINAA